jgi:hypothetical protein
LGVQGRSDKSPDISLSEFRKSRIALSQTFWLYENILYPHFSGNLKQLVELLLSLFAEVLYDLYEVQDST